MPLRAPLVMVSPHYETLPSDNLTQIKSVSMIVKDVEGRLMVPMLESISALSAIASQQPYYKFNHMWSRQMQEAVRLLRHERRKTLLTVA